LGVTRRVQAYRGEVTDSGRILFKPLLDGSNFGIKKLQKHVHRDRGILPGALIQASVRACPVSAIQCPMREMRGLGKLLG